MSRKRSPHGSRGMVAQPICVECDQTASLVSGARVYPHRPDLHGRIFYQCDCGAYVGCHPGTAVALGRPAGRETRRLRSLAHELFDPFWKPADGSRSNSGARSRAYRWLADELGLPVEECHIGWFDAAMCRRVIAICRSTERKVA